MTRARRSPERKMAKKKVKIIHTGVDEWMSTYGDMVTLGFFGWGMLKKNYLNLKPMLIAYGITEFLSKILFGVN